MKRGQVNIDDHQDMCSFKAQVLLECRVCGAPAHGYNFDQITCESCKAFFRRNALKPTSKFHCRFSGSCQITVETRRQCTSCRLEKCFQVKMRKEWIRTDEERQRIGRKRFEKEQKHTEQFQQLSIVERNQNRFPFDQMMARPIFNHRFSSNFTVDHHSLINNLTHSYDKWALLIDIEPIKSYSLERSGLVQFVNDEERMYRSLIEFFREIPEFRAIPVDDQILLIKCNLTQSIHIHYLLKYHFVENTYIGSLMNFWIGASLYSRIARTRRAYDYFIEHPIILKLSLVMMLFTINLSRLPERDLRYEFQDRRSLIGSQEMYATLLWNYLNSVFDERRAVQSMCFAIFQYLRYQHIINEMDSFIGEHFHREQFRPLMKSVLRLT